MHRRFLMLAAIVVLVALGTTAFAASFPDVQGTVYQTAFSHLNGRGVVQGYPDGNGRPYHGLNRAEALKVILSLQDSTRQRAEWLRGNMPPMPLFADIDQTQWYAPYVEAAYEQKLITGYPDGTFRPGQYLRTEEAIALVMRALNVQTASGPAQLSPFIQNREGEWFTPFINAAIEKNLVMKSGQLTLGNAISRGQFFDLVYRLDTIRTSGATAFTGPEPDASPAPAVATGGAQRIVMAQATVASTTQVNVGQPAGSTTLATISIPSRGNVNGSEKHFAIAIPSLGITDLTVTHPADAFSDQGIMAPLKFGVGHLFSYPGGKGKILLYGHSSGYPWDVSQYTKIFRQINKLNPGDKVYVTYGDRLHTYEVTHEQTVNASDTSIFNDNGGGEQLVLYTCWPPDSISQRYVVFARPVQEIAAR